MSNGLIPYLSYFIPTDGIQWVFFGIIVILCIFTSIWLFVSARPKQWEKIWINSTPDKPEDDLNIEHGSLQELNESVATKAEKLADALPNMFLIIGLMGTFLGVGVALNNAASVLNDNERPAMDMLQEMVQMLDGLGALFKSSIYGISGFFIFIMIKNCLHTERNRFLWCVEKCNTLLKKKQNEAEKFKEAQEESTKKIVQALDRVNKSIGESIADCIQKSLQTALVKGFEKVNQNISTMNSSLCKTLEETIVQQFISLEEQIKIQVDNTKKVATNLKNVSNAMTDVCTTMNKEFTHIVDAAQKMGEASTSLSTSVDNFTPAVTATLNNIETNFVKSIKDSGKIMENAGKSIRNAVAQMASDNQKGQEKLDSTLDNFTLKIGKVLVNIHNTTTCMEKSSNATIENTKEIRESIENSLQTVSKANLAVRDGMKKFPGELSESINKALYSVKDSFEASAEKNIAEMKKGFENLATKTPQNTKNT